MTIAIGFQCTNGVVFAADSMITPSMGNLNVGHHHGKKIDVISSGPQLFAFAGDQGQAARFKIMAELSFSASISVNHPIEYCIVLSQGINSQFKATGIVQSNVNALLSFQHGSGLHCCVFEGAMQPRLLDANHYYVALGSGKLSADPFLRYLVDTFCSKGQPNLREAVFLATWVVQHVIDTNPGGVAGPIRIATHELLPDGSIEAKELPLNEIQEHQQAIESATEALRSWRDTIHAGKTTKGVPPQPSVPKK